MRYTGVCPNCGNEFTNKKRRTWCGVICSNKDPGLREKRNASLAINAPRGEDHPLYKGGVRLDKRTGRHYCLVPVEERHMWGGRSSVLRYHMVWMKSHPDDPILPGQVIHHINHNPSDDRPENLMKLTKREHEELHAPENPQRLANWLRRGRPTCSVPNCGKPSHGDSLCGTHWARRDKYGDPLLRKVRFFDPNAYRTVGWRLEREV